MRFIPHTPADLERMLDEIGAGSVAELFRSIPESLRSRAALSLPAGLDEQAVAARMADLASAQQALSLGSFRG